MHGQIALAVGILIAFWKLYELMRPTVKLQCPVPAYTVELIKDDIYQEF